MSIDTTRLRELRAAVDTVSEGGTRCLRCRWPLAESRAEGCVPGNCSYRPGHDNRTWEPAGVTVFAESLAALCDALDAARAERDAALAEVERLRDEALAAKCAAELLQDERERLRSVLALVWDEYENLPDGGAICEPTRRKVLAALKGGG